jgi:uncharacterized BrkB/YihY/UPF0761 family membrane protein
LHLIHRAFRVALDAFYRFVADDGWAIASHIALSTLMSLFPFLILITAIAGFIGSKDLADEVAEIIVEAWPREVSSQIAGEIHSVLTEARGDFLTVGAVFAIYFASSGVESLRIGLNRAYGLTEPRPWWLLRLESIGYVLVAAIGMLAFSFLVVLAPLAFQTALLYAPFDPAHVATGGPAAFRRGVAGHRGDAGAVARLRLRLRPLSRRFFLHLRALLRRPRLGDDGVGVPVFHRVDLHLRRRAQRRDRAGAA